MGKCGEHRHDEMENDPRSSQEVRKEEATCTAYFETPTHSESNHTHKRQL